MSIPVPTHRTFSRVPLAAMLIAFVLLLPLLALPAGAQDAPRAPAQRENVDAPPEAPPAPDVVEGETPEPAQPAAEQPAADVVPAPEAIAAAPAADAEPAADTEPTADDLADIAGGEEASSDEPSAYEEFLAEAAASPAPSASPDELGARALQGDLDDTDGDGILNGDDLDDDNDGLTDVVEGQLEVNTVAGNHFWVVFPRNYFTGSSITQTLYISGDAGTILTIDGANVNIPANGMYEHHVVKESTPGKHSQSTEIVSSAPVTIIAESYQRYTAEAWVVLPTPTLGTDYTGIGYPTSVGGSSPNFNAEINLVSSADNTTVNIDGTVISLNEGEGYLYDAGNRDLSGIIITADNPIAVLSSRRCLNTGAGACDIVGEQLFPDEALATEYFVPALAQPHATRVVASADNTEVRVNGTLMTTLSRGQHYQASGSGLRIETSQPTAAWMIALGGELPGDPVFVLLPGVENALLKSTFAAPQSLYNNYLIMMVGSADTGSVRLDDSAVPNNWIPFAGDPSISYQIIPVTAGVHTVTAASSFVPIVYGETNYGSYGFVAGFGKARLGTTDLVGEDGEVPEALDTDGDGTPDAQDLDSDNDGISDLVESGQDATLVDTDNSGRRDAMEGIQLDGDADGLDDGLELTYGPDTGHGHRDSDGDGLSDYLDLDSDNDGIPDAVEAQLTAFYVGASGNDRDDDGVDDAWDAVDGPGGSFGLLINTDALGDGPDVIDTDSDADGVDDVDESGLTLAGADANGDGIDDGVGASYADADGVVNTPSTDLANEVGDTTEVAYREAGDADGDGVPDATDIDDDNDGILDTAECGASGGLGQLLTSSADAYAAAGADEWVSITAAEYAALASEVDGASAFGTQPGSEKSGTFANFASGTMYTFGHSNNPSPAGVYVYAFSRGTGIATTGGNDLVRLSSSTSTGFNQYGSALPNGTLEGNQEFFVMKDPSVRQATPMYIGLSTDQNNLIYYRANGTTGAYAPGSTANVLYPYHGWSLQGLAAAEIGGGCDDLDIDTDGDGIPNRLDLDSDNDGISDLVESGQAAGFADADSSGMLDDMEAGIGDADGDGLSDAVEAANGPDSGQPPVDSEGDGITDHLDLDSDNDGIPDVVEAQPTIGYTPATGNDADTDGVDDAWDAIDGPGASFSAPVNTDGADTADYIDTDSDADGTLDIDESGLALAGTDANGDGIDDGVNASFTNPDGIVDAPANDLRNETGTDTTEVAYREEAPMGVAREVVFLVDGSLSIDAEDWAIQLGGIAAALRDPSAFPLDGSVAVGLVQWSDGPETEVPYTVLRSAGDLDAVVDEVLTIRQNLGGTSPEAGITAGARMLNQEGSATADQVLCMSTDGKPVSPSNVIDSSKQAWDLDVDNLAVLAIDDPSRDFDHDDAMGYYSEAVFGTGSVVHVRSSIEFASLVVSGCLAGSVSLVGLEVNQAIQDWSGSIPLVESKPTVVRAFVQSSDSEPDRVVARLHGERNGVALDQSPIVALNDASSVLAYQNVSMRRGDLNSSLNFELPDSWLSGDVTLRLEVVGSEIFCKEAVAPANTCTADITFNQTRSPEASLYRVQYTDAGVSRQVTSTELNEQARRIESALPISDLVYYDRALYTGVSTPPSAESVAAKLLAARNIDGNGRLYLGILEGDRDAAVAGSQDIGSGAWYLDGLTGAADAGFARNQGVQVFTRALGLPLAANGVGNAHCTAPNVAVEGASTFPTEAFIGGETVPTLGRLGDADTEVWGLDTRHVRTDSKLAVVDPNTTFSVMGNCDSTDSGNQGRWIDSSYYASLVGTLNAIDWSVGPQRASSSEYSFFRGALMGGAVTFDDMIALEPGVVPAGQADGEYTLELRNAAGAVIESVDFAPTELDGTDGVFTIPVENNPEFDSAVVMHAGAEIGRMLASDNAPTVTIVSPTSADILDGDDLTVTWIGEDADGDALTYLVQYSVDAGETWDSIAIDFEGTELVIPADALVGSDQVRIRVTASDGALSGSAISDVFSVANTKPMIDITDPADGQRFDGVQSVYLEAEAFDAEDGELNGDAISWSSNLSGLLGNGAQVVMNAADLEVGMHTMTAFVTDSGGRSAIDTITVEIQRVAEAPASPEICQGLTVTVDLAAGDVPTDGDDVILGTNGDDTIAAGAGNDIICALAGNDVVYGQAGDDTIYGDNGEDKLRGGDGNDQIFGGDDADDLAGGRGNDEVLGEAGNDKAVRGGTGDDLVDGGSGDDALVAGNGGADTVMGGSGDDKVTGGARPDILMGGAGDDEVKGNKGADTMYGNEGADLLFGGHQADTMDGGEGDDDCNGGTTGGGALEGDTAVNCEITSNLP